ncbi:MAG: amino acid-binding protein [Thaumarchaeota archaeon]|nr:amino acid-binding protein [Nitrososphaerota archaeon]RLG07419.1 MAG: amino acid-binding protein [Nitrososphaerota archaeon]HDD40071.1 amino acid-binding protein [Nitrososphaeria archaeon]
MWSRISDKLEEFPARLKIIRLMIEYGIGVNEEGKIVVGPVEIPDTSIAKAVGVDRRVVRKTVEQILEDENLKRIFTGIRPAGAFLAPIAKELGLYVVEIRADPTASGVLAEAAKIIASEGISIRQAVAEDPELFPEPKLILVLERPLSGDGLNKMLKIPHVKSVTAY